jgi:hypothetical protein
LFDLNKVILLFLLKIYEFLTLDIPTLYKCLHSAIVIPYMSSLTHMEAIARGSVQYIARHARNKASHEMSLSLYQCNASLAVCEAIPYENNV